jgi:hypothetical protein
MLQTVPSGHELSLFNEDSPKSMMDPVGKRSRKISEDSISTMDPIEKCNGRKYSKDSTCSTMTDGMSDFMTMTMNSTIVDTVDCGDDVRAAPVDMVDSSSSSSLMYVANVIAEAPYNWMSLWHCHGQGDSFGFDCKPPVEDVSASEPTIVGYLMNTVAEAPYHWLAMWHCHGEGDNFGFDCKPRVINESASDSTFAGYLVSAIADAPYNWMCLWHVHGQGDVFGFDCKQPVENASALKPQSERDLGNAIANAPFDWCSLWHCPGQGDAFGFDATAARKKPPRCVL